MKDASVFSAVRLVVWMIVVLELLKLIHSMIKKKKLRMSMDIVGLGCV